MNFEEAKSFIENLPRFSEKSSFDKTKAVLKELGDFSKEIPTVQVAGTNGKGSVCAYLCAAFKEAGMTVACFTSPHLVDIRERFMINDCLISEREFTNVFNVVMEEIEEYKRKTCDSEYFPPFFDFLFFMAAVWFKEKKPNLIILETGLGGRLDATNSVEYPTLSVITEIGLDHCEYLGDTKELIAGEKAGIIKPMVPVVHFSHNEPYDEVISRRAKEMNCRFIEISKANINSLETFVNRIDFLFQSLYDGFVKISLNTGALFQVENSALAYACVCELRRTCFQGLDMEKCVCGFLNMKWPCRMEEVSDGFVIDGGHNEDGIKAFLASVACDGAKKRSLLYSAVSDKDVEKVVSFIQESGLFDRFYVCRLKTARAASKERLKEAFEKVGIDVCVFDNVKDCYGEMMRERGEDERLYAVGSLYLAGEIKALIKEEEL